MAKRARICATEIRTQQRPTILHYRKGESCTMRVWRNDWPGDVFEVITKPEFDKLEWFCSRFSIPLLQASDED